jgi:hypothetical protein
MNVLDPGLIAGLSGMVAATACFVLLRASRVSAERQNGEFTALLRQHQADCSAKMDQLGRNLAVLESSGQMIEHLGRTELTRSRRSQAMQLLRSGMSVDTAAAKLGIARREMRLIDTVSKILSRD